MARRSHQLEVSIAILATTAIRIQGAEKQILGWSTSSWKAAAYVEAYRSRHPPTCVTRSLHVPLLRIPPSIIFGLCQPRNVPSIEFISPHPGAINTFSRPNASDSTLGCLFCGKYGSRLMHKRKGEKELSIKGGCLEGLPLDGAVHTGCKDAIMNIPTEATC